MKREPLAQKKAITTTDSSSKEIKGNPKRNDVNCSKMLFFGKNIFALFLRFYNSSYIKWWRSHKFFSAIQIFVTLFTILSHIITYSIYKSTQCQYPNSNYPKVSTFDILYHYSVPIFLFSCISAFYGSGNEVFWFCSIPLFLLMPIYNTYCVMGKFNGCTRIFRSSLTYDEYVNEVMQMTIDKPKFRFSAYGHFASTSIYYNCSYESPNIQITSVNDKTTFRDVDEDIFISDLSISINWSNTQKEFINVLNNESLKQIPLRQYDINWNFINDVEMDRFFPNTLIIKKYPFYISKTFQMILTFLYNRLACKYLYYAIPIVKQVIVKEDLRFDITDVDVDNVKCFQSWR